jgi:hypothetical protein
MRLAIRKQGTLLAAADSEFGNEHSNQPFGSRTSWNQSSGTRVRDFNHASIRSRLKRQSLPILNAGNAPRPANLQMVERLTLSKSAISPVVSRSGAGSAVCGPGSYDGRELWSRDSSLRPWASSRRFARRFKIAHSRSGLAFSKNSCLDLGANFDRLGC